MANINNYTTAMANAPTRKIFAPYFKGKQNLYGAMSDYAYLNLIPAVYRPYYITYIQQWFLWSRGYYPQYHKQDFFNNAMGYTVCEMLSKMCMSGGFRLNSTDVTTKEFIQEWNKDLLYEIFATMYFHTNAVGNALIVLTPVDGDLAIECVPITRATFTIGRTNKITHAMILNRFVAGESCYYTREHRVIKDGKAYYKVQMAECGLATVPTWNESYVYFVPDIVRPQWEACYGSIELNKWYELPSKLNGLGVYNVKNKAIAVALSDLPGYSDSTLHTCEDILYAIDYNFTNEMMDQYLGQSRALIPKQMASKKIVAGKKGTLTNGMSFEEAENYYEPELDKNFYTEITTSDSIDGKPVQPTFLQPDLRSDKRKQSDDHLIEKLAAKIGINASTLATHLAIGSRAKTDDEISKENENDEKTIGDKRRLASATINKLLTDVAKWYGLQGDVTIEWGKVQGNSTGDNQQLLMDYQAGTISLKDYIRRRFVDLTEDEIEQKVQELEQQKEKEQQEQQQMNPMFNDKDYFNEQANSDNNGFGNDNKVDRQE